MKDPYIGAAMLILVILPLACAAGLQNSELAPPSNVYLFSPFGGNGDGLHPAWSVDGLKWTAPAGDRSFLGPKIGGKLLRDPCVLPGPEVLKPLINPQPAKKLRWEACT